MLGYQREANPSDGVISRGLDADEGADPRSGHAVDGGHPGRVDACLGTRIGGVSRVLCAPVRARRSRIDPDLIAARRARSHFTRSTNIPRKFPA